MALPVLLDTDMGVDDAIALTLALCAESLDVVGIASVGGNVSARQAVENVGRCLGALQPARMPPVTCGLDQTETGMPDATALFGADGLGNINLPVAAGWTYAEGLSLYGRLAAGHGGQLVIVAIGPLTNLAAVLADEPQVLARAGRIVIMGGAVFCPGNITPKAEFNIYRDCHAAARVLGSGLPITLIPLDVTRKVILDESHRARLAASGARGAQMLAAMMEHPMAQGIDGPPGQLQIHDALAVGVLLWPELFLQTQMAVTVTLDGADRGRTAPAVGRGTLPRISVVLSVQVAEFVENLLEVLCSEEFFV